MRFKLTPVVAALCLLGIVNTPVFAAEEETAKVVRQDEVIKKLNERTLVLESELRTMRAQIKQLTATKNTTTVATGKVGAKAKRAGQQAPTSQDVVFERSSSIPTGGSEVAPLYFLTKKPIYLGGTPIVVSPYLGLRSEVDINDLIVTLPYVNEDLRLLKQRQELAGLYNRFGMSMPTEPMVDFSGKVEAKAIGQKSYVGKRSSDIDLSGAELDIAALVNPWAMGFMAIVYDDNPPAQGTGRRVDNSRLYIDKAFVTFGNLVKSPIYMTMGQFFVPFGQYGSYMISDPLTKFVGRIKSRAILLGYNQAINQNNTINGSIFALKGDAYTKGDHINNYGANLDYSFSRAKWSGNAAVSYVANIADSQGMQRNGGARAAGSFTGFANTSSNSEVLRRKIPGVDVRGSLGYGDYSVMAEYVTAAQKFSPYDLTYNGSGAKPDAIHIEGVYNFIAWGKKSLVAIGYDQTRNALALLLPQQRYLATFSTSLWDQTIQSLEFRHDINYGSSANASGQGVAVDAGGIGRTSDMVTFQIGIYF